MHFDALVIAVFFTTGFACGLCAMFFTIRHGRNLLSKDALNPSALLKTSFDLIKSLEKQLTHHDQVNRVKTEAIRKIVYDSHHRGLNPILKTLRGLLHLLQLVSKDHQTSEYIALMEEQIVKAEVEEATRIRQIEHLQD